MGSNDHYEVPDPVKLAWWKRWLARVLGVKGGLRITIPPGATLIMPVGSVVDTINIVGGTVQYDGYQPRAPLEGIPDGFGGQPPKGGSAIETEE